MTRNSLVTLPILAALALIAAGCASPGEEAEKAIPNSLERFPLTAHKAPDETLLAVHAGGLSAAQHAAVKEVAVRWREADGETLTLRAPQPAAGDGAFAMAEQVRRVLVGEGVAYGAIKIEGYDPGADAAAPLVVAFSRYQAEVPACGKQWDNLTATQSNNTYANFGCSIAANMAAQIAKPADIVAPAQSTPADASRRSVVMDAYRRGEATGTKYDTGQSGFVSQAIK